MDQAAIVQGNRFAEITKIHELQEGLKQRLA